MAFRTSCSLGMISRYLQIFRNHFRYGFKMVSCYQVMFWWQNSSMVVAFNSEGIFFTCVSSCWGLTETPSDFFLLGCRLTEQQWPRIGCFWGRRKVRAGRVKQWFLDVFLDQNQNKPFSLVFHQSKQVRWPSPLVVEQEVHLSNLWAMHLQGCIIILL